MSKQKTMAEILGDIRNSSDKEKTLREFLDIPEIDVDKIAGDPIDPLKEKADAISGFAESLGVNILMLIMDPKTKQSSTAADIPFEVEGMDRRDIIARLLCGNVDSLARLDPTIGLVVTATLKRAALRSLLAKDLFDRTNLGEYED